MEKKKIKEVKKKEKRSGIRSFLKIEKNKVIISSIILVFGIALALIVFLNQPMCNEFKMQSGEVCPTNPFLFLLPISTIIFLPLVILFSLYIGYFEGFISNLGIGGLFLDIILGLVLIIIGLLLSLIYIYIISYLIIFIYNKIKGK